MKKTNIFSEIYGAYFRAACRALEKDVISESEINSIISEEAFADSALFLPKKLIPRKDGSDWHLLKENGGKCFSSVLAHKPRHIITSMQKRWLKSQLSNPRFRLFFDTAELEKRLEAVEPLYNAKHFRYVDSFSDGDNFEDENYIKHFREILSAVKSGEVLMIEFVSGKKQYKKGRFLPLKIEYSRKNDKFRVYCTSVGDRHFSNGIINIGRITCIEHIGKFSRYEGTMTDYFNSQKCAESVTVEVSAERNGVERFMMEFASYEKRTELDTETGKCTVKLWYDRFDETELLIRLLSFGPVIEILGPDDFRQQAAERVKNQFRLLFENESN